jgi:CPA1 family monovalent cation:H+ antiporter
LIGAAKHGIARPVPLVVLLAIAVVVAIVARRLRLPYTVGLVLVGVGIALAKLQIGATLTHDFIFFVILPPLLFEAALALRWRDLWADAGLLTALSTLGTVVAAAVVAFGVAIALHWPAPVALVFGALIAATDPVAVIAMFKDNGVTGRLRTLLEAESLFNDAVAAILFSLAVGIATQSVGGGASLLGWHLLFVITGGVLIGAACGGFALVLAGRTSEHSVEVALTVLAAYGSFLAAEQAGASGILATVVSGLVVGNFGIFSERSDISKKAKEFALEFWEFAAFLANSMVFPLIGVAIGATAFAPGAALSFATVIMLVLIARAVTIYPISFAFTATRQKVPMAHQHVLWWGGLRGALALALALSLPDAMPYRSEIVVTTFAVVAFSIIAQGLTMPLLLRRSAALDNARQRDD